MSSEKEQGLTLLGRETKGPVRKLERFPNRHPGRDYVVRLETNEFTTLCPITGQPDFATIIIEYVPDKWIVESKSLKLYFWSFRDEGNFHEHVTNLILDDLVNLLDPIQCKVVGKFNVRGGIAITVEATYERGKDPKPGPGTGAGLVTTDDADAAE